MVRDNRIKEYRFAAQTLDATENLSPVYTDQTINGEILEVQWGFNRTGSVWLAVSGTGEELWRRNAPSGAGTQIARPRAYVTESTGAIATGSPVVPYVAHAPLYIAGSQFASGTQTLSVVVLYR